MRVLRPHSFRHMKRTAAKIVRFALSVVYAYLIFAMSGFTDLAYALSCTDVISSQTRYKYNETLYNFKYTNGKTYAMALSGITGAVTAPDNFFAFTPGFTYEYLYGGADSTSLKAILPTGKYGAARPVAVTSEAIKTFLVENYGSNLAAGGGTLVDAWKEYGAGAPVTTISGATLPYTNWATPPDATLPAPAAIAMAADGKWSMTTSGTYKSQIVEFDGKLDCAVDMDTPPPPPPPPPPVDPEAEIMTQISVSGLACLADANGDGEINGSTEAAECLVTGLGNLCPIGALDCDTTFQPPICPAGSVLDTERDMCQADHLSVSCPAGHTWDGSIDKCVADPTCPDGGIFNAATDRCEKVFAEVCPVGYTNAGGSLCTRAVECAVGTYNQQTDRCESIPGLVSSGCPEGMTFNEPLNRCEVPPTCADGFVYNTTYNKCLQPVSVCANGYTWNTTRQRCELAPPVCPAGTSYNATANRCEANPGCLSGTYDATLNSCLETSTYTATATHTCPSGGSLAADGVTCVITTSYAATQSTIPFKIPIGYQPRFKLNCTQYSSMLDCSRWVCGDNGAYGYLTANPPAGCNVVPTYNYIGYAAQAAQVAQSGFVPLGNDISYNPSGGLSACYKNPVLQHIHVYPNVAPQCAGTTNGAAASASPTPFAGSVPFPGGGYISATSADVVTYSCPYGGILAGASCTTSNTYVATITYSCPSGGTLSGTTCTTTSTSAATCPAGTTLDTAADKCVVNPTCPSGGALDGTSDVCYYAATACTAPAVYDAAAGQCAQPAICAGGTLDGASDLCLHDVIIIDCSQGFACPPDFTQSGAYCVKAPECDSGTAYDAGADACIKPVDNCPVGTSWVAARTRCEKIPTDCPAGTTFDVAVKQCISTPACVQGTYSAEEDSCVVITGYPGVCPDGYTWDGASCVSGTLSTLKICPSGGALNTETNNCENLSFAVAMCPANTILDETLDQCTGVPACAGGAFDPALGICSYSITPCLAPFGYNATVGQCAIPAICSAGSILNTSTDQCSLGGEELCQELVDLGPGCPAGYLIDDALGLCYTSPVCGSGTYVSSLGRCEAAVVQDCGTFSFDAETQKCINPVLCPTELGPAEALGLSYSNELDVCVQSPTHACDPGLTWTSIPINQCEAAPICTGAIYYDPAANSCLAAAGCPYGDQFTCMPNAQGTYQCSPNECFDTAGDTGVELEPFTEEYLQDDGEKDAEGNCLGQIYIFNGKPSRCRPAGWTVGYINNCCAGGDLMPEDTGTGVGAICGAYSMYKAGKAAYEAYQGFQAFTNGTASISTAASGSPAFASGYTAALSGSSMAGNMASNALEAAGPAIAVYAVGAIAGALGGDQDVQMASQVATMAAIYALAPALLSGPQAVVGIIVIVVMRFVMGTGCDAQDIMTANDVKSNRCHYIGSYCEKRIFGACVQKAKGHCCFNSILSRIIHEQGRPQLTSFQPGGAWGPAKKPNCRGFTPEEFQSIDFSKIDLTEYYGTVLKDIEQKVQGATANVTETITNKFQQIQGVQQQ